MSHYEYRVVPAPHDAPRAKGVRGTEARFARGLAGLLNQQAAAGWEYQRTETMTAQVRRGFFGGHRTETVCVAIFRRWVEGGAADDALWSEAPQDAGADATAAHPGAPAERGPRQALHLGASRRPDVTLRSVPAPGRD